MLREINLKLPVYHGSSPARRNAHAQNNADASRQRMRHYRREKLRKIKNQEYRKLRALVPAVASKSKVSKVTVIEETIKYIDELHQALTERLGRTSVDMNFFLGNDRRTLPDVIPQSNTSGKMTSALQLPKGTQRSESPECLWLSSDGRLHAPASACNHHGLHLSSPTLPRIS